MQFDLDFIKVLMRIPVYFRVSFCLLWLVAPPVHGQQITKPVINGPTAIATPNSGSYSVTPFIGYRIKWWVKSPDGEFGYGINGVDTSYQVTVSFAQRGVDTLIVEIYPYSNMSLMSRDTLLIHKNTCNAVGGNLTATSSSVCKGGLANIAYDDVIGDIITWQSTTTTNGEWKTLITGPAFQMREYVSSPLFQNTYYRASVSRGTCIDTSDRLLVRADDASDGSFSTIFPDPVCGGSESKPLGAVVIKGQGTWSTTGKGTFTNIHDGNGRYVAASNDAKFNPIIITWTVKNGACPAVQFGNQLVVKPPPDARFVNNPEPVCPGNATAPLQVEQLSGSGQWLQPVNSLGYFLKRNDPHSSFMTKKEDAGKRIELTWEAKQEDCSLKVSRFVDVQRAGTAKVAFPATTADQIICKGDAIKLVADTSRRLGYYLWSSSHPIITNPNNYEVTVRPNVDSAVYVLTFVDFSSGCRSRDTVIIYPKRTAPAFETQHYLMCPADSLSLNVPDLDTNTGSHWSPAGLLEKPQSSRPLFIPGEHDVEGREVLFEVEGRSLTHKCTAKGQVYVRVQPLVPADAVDLSGRSPRSFCVQYPSELIVRNKDKCADTYWFRASKSEAEAAGSLTPGNPYFVSASSVKIDSLRVRPTPYTYCVTCRDLTTNCRSVQEFSFDILKVPKPLFVFEKRVYAYNERSISFINRSEGALNYSWDFGDPASAIHNNSQEENPDHEYIGAGRFIITLVADNGACSKSFTDSLRILGEEFYFPNAFSPNGDAHNNLFRPLPAFWNKNNADQAEREIAAARVRRMEIYDQWGNRVRSIEGSDWPEKRGWDGRNQSGSVLAPGAYFFKVVINQDPFGDVEHTGYVTLIR